jgi:hypothetical protein
MPAGHIRELRQVRLVEYAAIQGATLVAPWGVTDTEINGSYRRAM